LICRQGIGSKSIHRRSSCKKNENNQNKVDSNEKEHMRLQNTSLDYETLEKEYEIPKMEQFVNLEKGIFSLKKKFMFI
jgi:hypothetical protein